MTATSSELNGQVPPAAWRAHIAHHFHPHRHLMIGKERQKCSGRWWCETDKTWIDGPKCEDK